MLLIDYLLGLTMGAKKAINIGTSVVVNNFIFLGGRFVLKSLFEDISKTPILYAYFNNVKKANKRIVVK